MSDTEPRRDLRSFLGLLFESMAAAGEDPIKVWGWLYDYLIEAGWDEEAERLLNTPWPLGPESHSPAVITPPKGKPVPYPREAWLTGQMWAKRKARRIKDTRGNLFHPQTIKKARFILP